MPSRIRFLLLLLPILLLAGQLTRAADAPPEVAVGGTVSAKTITIDELLKFTLSVKNNTSAAINSVRLVAAPDSYEFATVQGCGGNAPPFYSDANSFAQGNNLLMPSVAAGASCTAWGYLKPTHKHAAATLTVIVEWQPAKSSAADVRKSVPLVSNSAVVVLGENAVETYEDRRRQSWIEAAKILVVPAVLSFLAFVVPWMVKRGEERSAIRSETQKQMLQTSLEYAAKYYLPLSAAAERLVDALQPANPAFDSKHPNAAPKYLPRKNELVLYYVIYLEKRMDEQRKVIGGFYFKELSAEKLASACWKEYSDRVFTKDVDNPLSRAVQSCLNRLEARENYEAFAAKFKLVKHPIYGDSKAKEAAIELDQRLTAIDIDRIVLLLNALQAIIDFEVNRPFEYWYDKPATLNMTAAVKTLLMTKAGPGGLQFTSEEMKYFEQARIISG
jgi:hypothetical protein